MRHPASAKQRRLTMIKVLIINYIYSFYGMKLLTHVPTSTVVYPNRRWS